MDLIILSIWFPVTACEVILVYLAFITGIASLVKQRDYSSINTPVVLLLLLTTLLSFKSTSEVFSFGNFSSPVLVLSYQPVLFLLIWLLSFRYPVRENSELQSLEQAGKQQKDENHQAEPDGEKDGQQHAANHEKARESKRYRTARNRRNPAPPMLQSFTLRSWEYFSNILLFICLVCVGTGLWMGKQFAGIGIACGITYGVCTVFVVLSSYMELYLAKQQQKG
jgi:Ca2+/Na+ antiporter